MIDGYLIMRPRLWSPTLSLCICLVLCINSCRRVNSMKDLQHNLNFMLVVSFGQSGFNSSGVIPAADIALEDINNDPDLLPGYNLTYDRVRDSQVSSIMN